MTAESSKRRSRGWASEFVCSDKNALYLLGLSLFILSYFVSEALFRDSLTYEVVIIRVVAYIFMVFAELTSREKPTGADYFGLLAITFFFISAYVAGATSLLQVAIAIYFGRNVDLKSICRVSFYTILVGFCSVILLVFAGFIDENVVLVGDRTRSSLGFAWPSRPQNYVLTIVMLYMVLYGRKAKMSHYLALFFLAFVVYLYCDSRAPFFLTVLCIVLGLRLRGGAVSFRHESVFGLLVGYCFVIGLLFTFALAYFYDSSNPVWHQANTLLSGRLEYSHSATHNYPLTLFGSPDFGSQNDAFFSSYLDTAYLNLLYTYGLAPTVIYMLGLTAIAKRSVREKNVFLASVMVVCAIHAVTEAQLLMLQYTPFLILMIGSLKILEKGQKATKGERDFVPSVASKARSIGSHGHG